MADTLFRISAFADEISPDPKEQLDVLERCGVKFIELRSIQKINVLDLSDDMVKSFQHLLKERGVGISAIGSPIGKIKINESFDAHMKRFDRAVHLAKVFNTPNIRVFSYYPAEDGRPWADHRNEVIRRITEMADVAIKNNVRLVHENEHRIYGEDPIRVLDLFRTIKHPGFKAAFDPANYVHGGYDAWNAWQMTKEWTVHFHIKDWKYGEEKGHLAGTGHGQIPKVMADMRNSGFQGFATLEPHLLGGGPTGGVTGPELFPKAVAAFTKILDEQGIKRE